MINFIVVPPLTTSSAIRKPKWPRLNRGRMDRHERRDAALSEAALALQSAEGRIVDLNRTVLASWTTGEGPKLAVAREHWPEVDLVCRAMTWCFEYNMDRLLLGPPPVAVPRNLVLRTQVPHIPALVRSAHDIRKTVIAWEVEKWERALPKDPVLLRVLVWPLAVVLADWDTTDLERQIL